MLNCLSKVTAITVMLSSVSCHKTGANALLDTESIKLEGSRVELEHRLAVARLRADRHDRQTNQDLTPIRVLANLISRHRELEERKAGLIAEVHSFEESLLTARAAQIEIARSQMTGKELASLQCRSGRTFEQVKIVAIDDSGVRIRHAIGSARLGFEDLTDTQREQFGMDEGLAMAAITAESQKLHAYEQSLDEELAAIASRAAYKVEEPLRRTTTPPTMSAFDRRVSLGSASRAPSQTVARYSTVRRRSSYYYTPNYYSYPQPGLAAHCNPLPTHIKDRFWSADTPIAPTPNPSPQP